MSRLLADLPDQVVLFSTWVHGVRQGSLDWHVLLKQALPKSLMFKSTLASPVGNGLSATVPSHQSIDAHVVSLFARGGPATVTRLVIAALINSIKRVTGRGLFAHVGKEHFEAAAPSDADLNPSAAVVVELVVPRVVAAIPHVAPRRVFRGALATVRPILRSAYFRVVTAAAFGSTGEECAGHDRYLPPTRAAAAPAYAAVPVFGARDDREAPNMSTGQVGQLRHRRDGNTLWGNSSD